MPDMLKEKLARLSFLDTAKGLEGCAGDEEFYLDIVRTYLEENILGELGELYLKADWRNYRIKVHGLKSSSLYIGAVEISERAKRLELAAKANDTSFLSRQHYRFTHEYQVLLQRIDSALNNAGNGVELMRRFVVLVVDDDALNRKYVTDLLSKEYVVLTASRASEALALLFKRVPDLILLDVYMPGMDGFQMLEKIRSEMGLDVPVMMMTVDRDEETERRGFESGAEDFISKPLRPKVLMARLARLIELDQLRRYMEQEVRQRTQRDSARRNEAEGVNVELIGVLVKAIEAKVKLLQGQSARVAQLSWLVGKELGLETEQLQRLQLAALLHDIGMLTVPAHILTKQCRLTEEEYAQVKNHAAAGAELLSGVHGWEDICAGVRSHHECYDGSGYPQHLSGSDIPQFASIIGVCDAYAAMTAARPYREAMSMTEATAEIAKGMGMHFDLLAAQALLDLAEDGQLRGI